MKTTKIIFAAILLILNLSIAFAANNYNFNLYDYNTNAPINSVTGLFYECQVSGCADNVEPNRFATANSGSSNLISQNYLGTSTPQDYLSVFLTQCYLPISGVTSGDWGTGQTYSYDVFLPKALNCHSPIFSYTVLNSVNVNEPIQVDVIATLDANTASAFKRTGFPPLFTPSGYESYFSANTQVTLEITNSLGQVVNTQTRNVDIPVDTQIPVHFEWTPTIAGTYNATIKTDVTDCQCESETQEHVSSLFTVLQDEPISECYTILNNLQSNDYFPYVNETLTLTLDKTSNYANNLGALSPVATKLNWTITNLNTNQVSNFITNHNSNSNPLNPTTVSTQFTPTSAGQYLISVQGISNDIVLCTGTNIPMSTQMTLTVSNAPTTCTDIDGDGYSQEGGVCGQVDCADTNANIHPGATEICNGVDDNCNSQIDEGFGLNAACNVGTGACLRTGVTVCTASGLLTQCSVVAGTPSAETCNNIDDNCNGLIDDSLTRNLGQLGICSTNTQTCVTGNWINNSQVLPTTEVCNNFDDDCDGQVDEGGVCTIAVCIPGSTSNQTCNSVFVGICSAGLQIRTCQANSQWGAYGSCVANIQPGTIAEICNNGVDDDCDGFIDGNDSNCVVNTCIPGNTSSQSCNSGLFGVCAAGSQVRTCQANGTWGAFGSCVNIVSAGAVNCTNGLDNNCNGVVDGLEAVCTASVCTPGATSNQSCGVSSVGTCRLGLQSRVCLANSTWGVFGVCVGAINPIIEICNSADDNCDGLVDNGLPIICSSNANCNDNNSSTLDICNNAGTCFSSCSNTRINLPPVAIAGANRTIFTNQTTALNGNASYDPDGTIIAYLWQISDGRSFNGVLQNINFSSPGVYNATLTVTDNNGATASDKITINVSNPVALIISISANPATGIPPLQVFFTSNIISGNSPFLYFWDFGDGSTSTEQNPVHVFYDEKINFVTLRVTDALGNIATATISINTKQEHSLESREAVFITNFDVLSNNILPGDRVEINTGFKNIAGKRLNDATITISIPELGIIQNAKFGRMKNGESIDKTFYLEIPSFARQGYHNVRLSFSANSGQVKRTEYRQILIR